MGLLMKPKLDLAGQQFGMLHVQSFAGKRGTQFHWLCVCECGQSVEVRAANLRSGNSTNCGCVRRAKTAQMKSKHGDHGTLTYARWKSMMQRCHNPNATNYPEYGGRGIEVCSAWRESFEAFKRDMGECPDQSMTLERDDGSKGYEPGNCRWATMAEQNSNRSMCILITRDGVTKTATDWARSLGLRPTTVIERLRRGWSHERALAIGDQRVKS